MIRKIKNSLAFRSASFYKILLKLFKPQFKKREVDLSLVYITLCGKDHVDMLLENLISLFRSSDRVPKIKIYSDGTLTVEELKKKLGGTDQSIIEIKHWEDTVNVLKRTSFYEVIEFARMHVIGKKLAVIISNLHEMPILWCDTDILWLKSYRKLNLNHTLTTSKDYQPSYTNSLIKLYPNLMNEPYVNTGLVYSSNISWYDSDLRNKLISALNETVDHFTEQSILGIAVLENGKNVWHSKEIACFQEDSLTLRPTYLGNNWVARHYVGPVRHLFWRDAFFLRIGLKP